MNRYEKFVEAYIKDMTGEYDCAEDAMCEWCSIVKHISSLDKTPIWTVIFNALVTYNNGEHTRYVVKKATDTLYARYF